MIFIHTLRMVAELSVYFFFAELFVVSGMGSSQIIPMLLLSLCYGILVYTQSRTFHKWYLALPFMVLFLPDTHVLALLPPIIYVLYLLLKEHTSLSWDRQSELFSLCIKLFLGSGLCICLSGNYAKFVQYSLPMAILSLATSIFLMRMLRHDPATYLSMQYQRKNGVIFLVVLFFAWLFSRDFVFELIGNTLSFIYMKGIYPILTIFISLFISFLRLIMHIFSWLKFGEIQFEENQLPEGQMGPTVNDLSDAIGKHVGSVQSILTIFGIILFFVCVFFFFRWLILHKGEESFISHGLDMVRSPDTTRAKKERATTTILQIRRQYRIFLKLYKEHGGGFGESFTSEDVLNQSLKILSNDSADILKEMRSIYMNARYRQTASKADLKRMKQINKELAQN